MLQFEGVINLIGLFTRTHIVVVISGHIKKGVAMGWLRVLVGWVELLQCYVIVALDNIDNNDDDGKDCY